MMTRVVPTDASRNSARHTSLTARARGEQSEERPVAAGALSHVSLIRGGAAGTPLEVTADGAGLVSHASSALLAQVADETGLTRALSRELAGLRQRRGGRTPVMSFRDLAVMLADGGDCLADLRAVRDQRAGTETSAAARCCYNAAGS